VGWNEVAGASPEGALSGLRRCEDSPMCILALAVGEESSDPSMVMSTGRLARGVGGVEAGQDARARFFQGRGVL